MARCILGEMHFTSRFRMDSHGHDERKGLRSRLLRRRQRDSDNDELIQISVGNHRFRALVIAEACRAVGLNVKLLMSDDSGYGNLETNRPLISARDLEQVTEVIQKTYGAGSSVG